MFVELHLLQNFAPSNLNRDDTNSPKDCEFGGFRRARISSQCLKRSIRNYVKDHGLLPSEDLAVRTKLIVDALTRQLTDSGKDGAEARAVAIAALAGVGIKIEDKKNQDDEDRTQYLLFTGNREIARIAAVCLENWNVLAQVAGTGPEEGEAGKPARSGREAKKAAKAAVPQEVQRAMREALDGGKAADLALFGRMLADLPDRNIDAACQVAHAVSTNKVGVEFDFYSAVDDLQPKADTGAGMLGTVEFNSACYYRYANIDLDQLTANLQNDTVLAREAVRAFITASFRAIPTGKQNSMAAHNLPSFALAVVRDRELWSLTNAFLQPVKPSEQGDIMRASIAALAAYWGKLARAYGKDQIRGVFFFSLEDGVPIDSLTEAEVTGQTALVDAVLATAYPQQTGVLQ